MGLTNMADQPYYYRIAYKASGIEMNFNAPSRSFAEKQLADFAQQVIPILMQPQAASAFTQPVENLAPIVQNTPNSLPEEPIVPALSQQSTIVETTPPILEQPVEKTSPPVENIVQEIPEPLSQAQVDPPLDNLLSTLSQDMQQSPTATEALPRAESLQTLTKTDTALNALLEQATEPVEATPSPVAEVTPAEKPEIALPFETPSAPLEPSFQAALEEALGTPLTPTAEPSTAEEESSLPSPQPKEETLLSSLDALIPEADKAAETAPSLTSEAEDLDFTLNIDDLKNISATSGSVFSADAMPQATPLGATIPKTTPTASSAQPSLFDTTSEPTVSAFKPSGTSTAVVEALPPRQLDEIETLQELFELTPKAVAGEDFLLLSAYFLSHYRSLSAFTLKDVNLELIRSGLTPVNHNVLEQVVEREWFEVLPHSGEAMGMTQYAITSTGLAASEGLMNEA